MKYVIKCSCVLSSIHDSICVFTVDSFDSLVSTLSDIRSRCPDDIFPEPIIITQED